MITIIIGVDWAVDPKNIGLAVGHMNGTTVQIDDAFGAMEAATQSAGSRAEDGMARVVDIISSWMAGDTPTLIAIDAPLGWPKPLGEVLSSHEAGAELRSHEAGLEKVVTANDMFRRQTDVVVKCVTDKQSLDVGANLIARTAHAALHLLKELRSKTDSPIPLAWEPFTDPGARAIEVYPAATLAALYGKGVAVPQYKKAKDGDNNRQSILNHLRKKFEGLDVPDDLANLALTNDHVLDAVICVLAGADFLRGKAIHPDEAGVPIETAKKEGWIWVRRPELV